MIYAGVSAYVANVRGLQDSNGGVLSHIKDLTQVYDKKSIGGPAYTTDKQVFHTDLGTDVVSLFALEVAAEGGTSRISSSWRVYNELAEKRPDLIRILAEHWPVDRYFYILHKSNLVADLRNICPGLVKIPHTGYVHCCSIMKIRPLSNMRDAISRDLWDSHDPLKFRPSQRRKPKLSTHCIS